MKNYIEEHLCRELNLMMVQVPLIVAAESGVNDMLDRDGSRTPVQFHIPNDRNLHPVEAQVVQAATKWKRMALKELGLEPGEGICTDMRAVPEGLLPGPRPQCLRRPVGLGARRSELPTGTSTTSRTRYGGSGRSSPAPSSTWRRCSPS